MLGSIALLVRNAPAIVRGVATLAPFIPDRWANSLNKVRTAAVSTGAIVTATTQPWDAETGLTELIRIGLLSVAPPEVALPAAPVASVVLTFVASTMATFITGYMTQESYIKLDQVDGE